MIEVTCNERSCRNWATMFTTPADNPKPWPMSEPVWPGDSWPIEPLWYACAHHRTDKHRPLPAEDVAPVCERCGAPEAIEWTTSGPAYDEKVSVWDRVKYGPQGPPSSNRAHPFCKECAADWNGYWDEMWKDYHSSIGI